MSKILLVEDDSVLARSTADALEAENHTVEILGNGQEALDYLAASQYDLIILDLDLPGVNGIEVCKRFRSKGGETPILMLTGRDQVNDKVSGFDSGADDYLTKPFHIKELSVRIKALLRRGKDVLGDVLQVGHLELDPRNSLLRRVGEPINLTPVECALLEFLMRHVNQVFSTEALLTNVWPADSEKTPETIRMTIKRVRAKIDKPGEVSMIENLHGLGYRLNSK